jgi:uncharacterized protein YhhL (DUF1145 family)
MKYIGQWKNTVKAKVLNSVLILSHAVEILISSGQLRAIAGNNIAVKQSRVILWSVLQP